MNCNSSNMEDISLFVLYCKKYNNICLSLFKYISNLIPTFYSTTSTSEEKDDVRSESKKDQATYTGDD